MRASVSFGHMVRKIIEIDEAKCNGCGDCVPNCPEGALQIVDGKARVTGEFLCDGLGACIGHCPQGAITIREKEAAAYDETGAMKNIMKAGTGAVDAHLKHLRAHGQTEYLTLALDVLGKAKIPPRPSLELPSMPSSKTGCPGSKSIQFLTSPLAVRKAEPVPSALTHWPIQLHLINPAAPQFQQTDVLLAADCTAFAMGGFHADHLAGKSLAIACPKLDGNQEIYLTKLVSMMDQSRIKSLTVMIMQVPCCGGLWQLAMKARALAKTPPPMQMIRIGLRGEILETIVPPYETGP